MSRDEKRAVVIGSGIGGAGCAAMLAKKGLEVILLERNSFPGGKAASFEKDGFVYDTGVHAVGNGDKGPLGEISRRVGGDLVFNLIESGERFAIGDNVSNFPLEYEGDETVGKILNEIGVLPRNFDDCLVCFKELGTMPTASEMEILDETPVKDFIDRYTDDPKFHQMVSLMCGMLLVLTYYQASVGEFIYCFSNMAENASLSYPVGGLRAIPVAYLEALERLGGTVEYEKTVEKILVEGGKVTGVVAGERIEADVVISNMGIQPTVEMIREHLETDYMDWAMSLRSTYGAVSVKYALDSKVVEPALSVWSPDLADREMLEKYAAIFCPVPSNIDQGLAPEGNQLVLAGGLVPPHPRHRDINEMMLDRIEAAMGLLYPGIEEHVVWKLRTGTDYIANISGRDLGDVVGIAQTYTQVGKNRPDPRMPVEGLYLVGADAGGRGIGTEMAGESALNVCDMVIADMFGE